MTREAERRRPKSDLAGCYEVDANGCWVWSMVTTPNGYGLVRRAGKTWRAHRYAWTLANGGIPGDLTIDHLCFNTRCVNPEHLRLLSRAENAGNRRPLPPKTHCVNGHEFTPENSRYRCEPGGGVSRQCRDCSRAYDRRRYWAQKEILAERDRLLGGAA